MNANSEAALSHDNMDDARPLYVRTPSGAVCNVSIATTSTWRDKASGDRYSTEVIAEQMQMLGGREDGQAGGAKAATGRTKDGLRAQ